MNCIQPTAPARRDRQVGAVVGLDFVDRGEDLPRHAVLDRRRLVDRQQEQRDPVEGQRLRRGCRGGQHRRQRARLARPTAARPPRCSGPSPSSVGRSSAVFAVVLVTARARALRRSVGFCLRCSTTVGASAAGAERGCGVARLAPCAVLVGAGGSARWRSWRGRRRGRRCGCRGARFGGAVAAVGVGVAGARLRSPSAATRACRQRARAPASGPPRPAAVRPPPASAESIARQRPAAGAVHGRHRLSRSSRGRPMVVVGAAAHIAGYAHRNSYRQATTNP